MLGSLATGIKHSLFTHKIYDFTYLDHSKRTALETIKAVISIKCMKNTQTALPTKKELKNFINNPNIQRLGAVIHQICLYLEFAVVQKNVTLEYVRKQYYSQDSLLTRYQSNRSSHQKVLNKVATPQLKRLLHESNQLKRLQYSFIIFTHYRRGNLFL